MKSSHHKIFECTRFMPNHYFRDINLNVAPSFSVLANLIMCLNQIYY